MKSSFQSVEKVIDVIARGFSPVAIPLLLLPFSLDNS